MSDPTQLPKFAREPEHKPDWYDYFGYLIAAAILIPLSLWVRHEYSEPIAAWLLSFGSGG